VGGHGRCPGVTQNTFGARLPGYCFLARRKMSHNYCGSRSRTAKKRHCSKLGPKIEKNSFMVPGTRLPGMVGRAHSPITPIMADTEGRRGGGGAGRGAGGGSGCGDGGVGKGGGKGHCTSGVPPGMLCSGSEEDEKVEEEEKHEF
jgi:hypothetical protein